MAYESVDQLQKMLADSTFGYAKDKKKAAGRALGTLVEIITFYLLKTWGLANSVAIERGLPEYKNPDIAHNVEFSLHPVKFSHALILESYDLPLTPTKIFKEFGATLQHLREFKVKSSQQLLTRHKILRNSCVIGEREDLLLVGLVKQLRGVGLELDLVAQYRSPYAMFECKRVGVEDGMRKGPQTIEKAKQGAYVARTVSSLQRIRVHSGDLHGVISKQDGTLYSKAYGALIEEIVNTNDPELLRNFILTVGVVSNHGNWFTSDNQNKELMVLAQSYDWLLFLTDAGLSEFIRDIVLSDDSAVAPAREAFKSSYSATKTKNSFTKVQMALEADTVLQSYFASNMKKIAEWFNIITPERQNIAKLRSQIAKLSGKDWSRIHKV
jgi:hypothetical protein